VFWRDFLVIIDASLRSILRRSLADPNARIGWFIVVGSIPAAVLGLLFQDFFEMLFASPRAAGLFLIVTAGLLALSEVLARRITQHIALDRLSWGQVAFIGSAQAMALAPGISRSGSTIAAGLVTGLRREVAARFSFLLGTPAFLGAGLLQLSDALTTEPSLVKAELPQLLVGFVVSAVVGVLAIRFLLSYLQDHTLRIFVIYCLVMGIFVIMLTFIRP
jgi:undecaprenyl-diphosphatase